MAQIIFWKKLRAQLIGWLISMLVLIVIGVRTLIRLAKKGKTVLQVKKRDSVPKIITDPKWGTHGYAKLPNQNIKLHYVEKGSREKPLLLCLHGFPECWFTYRKTLEEFSKDFWVVAVDMRGYGDSDKPTKPKDYTMDVIVDDIREFIEVLGREKCYLVAHDWGGVIAWVLVHRYPSYFIKHVSLNGPHPTAFLETVINSVSQSMKSWYMTLFQLWYLPERFIRLDDFAALAVSFQDDVKFGYKLNEEELEVLKYYFSLDGSLTGPLNYYRYAMSLDLAEKDMRCDEVESFIIWGSRDKALDKEVACRAFKYCNKLHAVFLPNSGHFVLQEFPQEVHAHMRKFLLE